MQKCFPELIAATFRWIILFFFTLYSPMPEGQSEKIAQLESELKDMQDRLLNVSMQYAEVEAQREELVMELKNVNAKKGRWF
jgi:predicted  nucleic acid-binding Zn-ribbon protein